MSELPEYYRPAAERRGIVEVGELPVREARLALKSSLSTMDAAVRTFEALVSSLADRGWIDPAATDGARRLHLVDPAAPQWLVPQPLLEIRPVAQRREVTVATIRTGPDLPAEDRPEEWTAGDVPYCETVTLPDIVPRGPTMFPGDLVLREGRASLEIHYDDRGVWCGSSISGGDSFWATRAAGRMAFAIDPRTRPPSPMPLTIVCRGDLGRDMTAAKIAEMIASTDQAQRVAARVWQPVPMPTGPKGVWTTALSGLRRAVFGDVPPDARWCVADGFAGTAIAWGSTLDEAHERWTEALWRTKPRPAAPTARPASAPAKPSPAELPVQTPDAIPRIGRDPHKIELGKFHVVFAPLPSAVPLPAYIPDNAPAAAIELPPLPSDIPRAFVDAGFTRWVRLVGGSGRIGHALIRHQRDDAITLVGEHVLDLVDIAHLDAEIEAAVDDQNREIVEHYRDDPEFLALFAASTWMTFRLWDELAQKRVFRFGSSAGADALPVDGLDGDSLAWSVGYWRR